MEWSVSQGVTGELIQLQGDWAFDAYKLYLRLDLENRVSVAMATSKPLEHD